MIISPSALNAIRRSVGPKSDEGLVDISRSTDEVTNYGVKAGELTVAVSGVAARFTSLETLALSGKDTQGLSRYDADELISFDAIADVRGGDVITKKALPWKESRYYAESQEVISNPWNNLIYTCIASGVSGSEAPTWPTVRGNTITDGSIVWRCEGACKQFTVTGLLSPGTYGDYISKKVFAKFRQEGE